MCCICNDVYQIILRLVVDVMSCFDVVFICCSYHTRILYVVMHLSLSHVTSLANFCHIVCVAGVIEKLEN